MATEPIVLPEKECDLVMRGGVTSGIVYPRAVLGLQKTYRFRNIGGTSAGAIAAAITAAAEYGRENEGYAKLEKAQEQICSEKFLFDLFQPSEKTRPLMDTALALSASLGAGRLRGMRTQVLGEIDTTLGRTTPDAYRAGRFKGAVWGALAGSLLGALTGLILMVTIGLAASPGGWTFALLLLVPVLVLGTLFGWVGTRLGGPILGAYKLFRVLTKQLPEENYFGICTGRRTPGSGDREALTEWLNEQINRLAGKDPGEPLTFGDLGGKNIEVDGQSKPVGITLKMVTTNLNHGEPYVFPREQNTFLFNEDEMRDFFDEDVVEYMIDNAYESQSIDELPDRFYFLPPGDKLPVIVAARMSLSFPILLSALPLHTIKSTAYEDKVEGVPFELKKEHLQRNWFSDGGICINFPIHFYDAWFPTRPTFGINLVPLHEGETSVTHSVNKPDVYEGRPNAGEGTRLDVEEPAERVFLPRPNDPDNPEHGEFKGLIGFLSAILSSAMNFRDTMQSRLPSYRERVVQVRLRSTEGGLNLDMPERTITFMNDIGNEVARRLHGFAFDHHQWVRFRVLMEQLETQLEATEWALGQEDVTQLLKRQRSQDFPYDVEFPRDTDMDPESWCTEAIANLEDLRTFIRNWLPPGYEAGSPTSSSRNFFRSVSDAEPKPELRVVPKL